MRYGVNFASNGRPLPPMLHIPVTYHNFPYVPNVQMITGLHPTIPVFGQPAPVAGAGSIVPLLMELNR